MDPATLAHFAQTWGLGFMVALFVAALAYALWPGSRAKFDRAARIPLRED
jgi:cytochrome c oxidase cbb3-type subunit 4